MIATVTNTSGGDINDPAVAEDGVSLPGGNHPGDATHRNNPLPFPFAHIGTLANAGTSVLGMRVNDWLAGNDEAALQPHVKWSMLVQAGTVTISQAAETGLQDPYEDYVGDVV